MADNGVTCSMSRSGNVWDNAAMESFFSSMKTERIGRKKYRALLQPDAPALDAWRSQPHGLRAASAFSLNAAMFVVEGVAGYLAGSRALQADALDFLGDAANYAISLSVAGMALAWRAKTAMVKGITILSFGFGVLIWAVWGLFHGSNPALYAISAVGALALVVNFGVALMLYRYRAGDANMRSVWICSRNDAINNCLVIGAGFAVLWTSSGLPDLIVALLMAVLGISGGWQVIRQARSELANDAKSPSLA